MDDEKYLVGQGGNLSKNSMEVRDFKEELFAGFAHDSANLLLKRYVETDRLQRGYNYKVAVAVDKKMFIIAVTISAAALDDSDNKYAKVIRLEESKLRLMGDDKKACTHIFEDIQDGLDEFVKQLPII